MSTNTTFTIPTRAPFRADAVGSYLRPAKLLTARAAFAAGTLDRAGLTAVEDEVIIDLIRQQEAAGLKLVTDGEFRRSWYHLDFFWGLQGVKQIETAGWQLHDGTMARGDGAEITGPLGGKHHPFVDAFKFVQAHVSDGVQVKQTLPSPAYCFIQFHFPDVIAATRAVYPTDADLIVAIAQAYDEVLADLAAAGATNIQFDDSAWSNLIAGTFVETDGNGYTTFTHAQMAGIKAGLLKANNLTIAGAPASLNFTAHICRGNYKSNWAYEGSYANIAEPLFTDEKVNGFYLEYDNARDGGFEVLRAIDPQKWVVLGLLTSKDGTLEDRQTIIDRIYEAAQFFPLDHLCLSPQCGFASSEEGNILTADQQWAKMRLIKSIVDEVWG